MIKEKIKGITDIKITIGWIIHYVKKLFKRPKVLSQEKKKWLKYITYYRKDKNTLTTTDHHRLALTEYMFKKETEQGRTLFHLTLTYKNFYNSPPRSPKNTDDCFINFYLRYLLKECMGTKNYHTVTKKALQPICYAFLDEHSLKSKKSSYFSIGNNLSLPELLHHHAIIAVHPSQVKFFKSLCGTNTIPQVDRFTGLICTSHMRECDAMCLLYASKQLKKYPDFLSFPDKFTRTKNRFVMTKHNLQKKPKQIIFAPKQQVPWISSLGKLFTWLK